MPKSNRKRSQRRSRRRSRQRSLNRSSYHMTTPHQARKAPNTRTRYRGSAHEFTVPLVHFSAIIDLPKKWFDWGPKPKPKQFQLTPPVNFQGLQRSFLSSDLEESWLWKLGVDDGFVKITHDSVKQLKESPNEFAFKVYTGLEKDIQLSNVVRSNSSQALKLNTVVFEDYQKEELNGLLSAVDELIKERLEYIRHLQTLRATLQSYTAPSKDFETSFSSRKGILSNETLREWGPYSHSRINLFEVLQLKSQSRLRQKTFVQEFVNGENTISLIHLSNCRIGNRFAYSIVEQTEEYKKLVDKAKEKQIELEEKQIELDELWKEWEKSQCQ